jgi:hypothetical protein
MTDSQFSADQIIYGWVNKKGKSGFQYITASSTLSEKDLSFLDKNNLPEGSDYLSKSEGRRLLILPSGKIAANYIKNIGKDSHGREGAMYSHFLILSMENFSSIKKNLTLLDNGHLKGITSIKDFDKLMLPDGNFMELPAVIIEIKESEDSYCEQFIGNYTSKFVGDTFYGIFLNLFQKTIKLNVVEKDFISLFNYIKILEQLLPPWILLTYSTYEENLGNSDSIIDIMGTERKLEGNNNVTVSFQERSVSFPGEDQFIRQVSEEYIRLIRNGSIYELDNAVELVEKSIESRQANFFLGYLIKSLCNAINVKEAIKICFKVMCLGIYGSLEEYADIAIEKMERSSPHDDTNGIALDYLLGHIKALTNEQNIKILQRFIPVFLKIDKDAPNAKTFLKLLQEASEISNEIVAKSLFVNIIQPSANIGTVQNIFSTIPNLYKSWLRYTLDRDVKPEELKRCIEILGDFSDTQDDILTLFSNSLLTSDYKDFTIIRDILQLVSDNKDIFDRKKIKGIVSQLRKNLTKRKILIPTEINNLMDGITSKASKNDDEGKNHRFKLRR